MSKLYTYKGYYTSSSVDFVIAKLRAEVKRLEGERDLAAQARNYRCGQHVKILDEALVDCKEAIYLGPYGACHWIAIQFGEAFEGEHRWELHNLLVAEEDFTHDAMPATAGRAEV